MSHLAEELKDTVRQTVPYDFSQLSVEPTKMEPIKLDAGGAPNLALVFGLVVAVITAGILGFFFTREAALRKQIGIELDLARGEQSRLEQSVAKLTSDAVNQRGDIKKLTAGLKEATTKASLIDMMKAEHETDLAKLKTFYEDQIAALKQLLQTREQTEHALRSEIDILKKALERGAVSAPIGAVAPQVSETIAPAASTPVAPSLETIQKPAGHALPVGIVLVVDQKNRFIVTDLGPAKGVQPGSFIQIYHNEEYLGEARVERVHQSLSAATVVSDFLLENVKEGDQAFLGLG
jgi:hypothetical protein